MLDTKRWLGVALVAGALAGTNPVEAQSAGDKAAAEALFDQGKKALKAKNYAEACPKFEESQKLDPGIGTMLFLADCYEKSGRVASAWATFREAAAEAKKAGDNRERVARKRAERLDAKLSRLVIEVPDGARVDGLEVKRDGQLVASALWGTGIPVDPGEHEISASAPGKKPFSTIVKVQGEGVKQSVSVPELEDAPEEEPPPVVAPPPPKEEEPPPPPPDGPDPVEESDGSGQATLGYVLGAVGVIGLGVGTIFGLQASSKDSDADKECFQGDPNRCTDKGVKLGDDAQSAATLSTVGFIAGGALLATGLVLVITAGGSNKEQARRFEVAPAVGQRGGGVWMRGAF